MTGPHDRLRPWTAVAIVTGLLGLIIGLADTCNFTVDDTFISFRYAENLAAGHGLVYNPGNRVEGFSNPLWTLLLAGLARTGWSQQRSPLALLQASKIAGAAFALATLALLSWFTIRMAARRPWGPRSGLLLLVIPCAASTYSLALWSMSGLETAMCACVVTLALGLHMLALDAMDHGEHRRDLLIAGGLAFGLLTWIRPEQPFVWGLTMAVFLGVSRGPRRGALMASVVPTLVLYGVIEVLRGAYYHELVPNSVVAKAGGGLVPLVLGAKYALAGIGGTVGFTGIGLCGLPALLRRGAAWQFVAIYCTVTVLVIAAAGGDWMPGFRLFVPMVPMLWVVAIAATLQLVSGLEFVPNAAVAAVLLLLAASAFATERKAVRAESPFASGFKSVTWQSAPDRMALAQVVRGVVRPGEVLATFEAGCVPYFCPAVRIQDDSGLNDPEIARLPGRHMAKMTADMFLRRAPDWFLAVFVRGGIPAADWLSLVRDPRFVQRYALVRRSDPGDAAADWSRTRGEAAMEEHLDYVLYRRR